MGVGGSVRDVLKRKRGRSYPITGPLLHPSGTGGHIVCHEQDDSKGQEYGLFELEYWVGPDI